jgi:CRP-like cAMP-binding protein
MNLRLQEHRASGEPGAFSGAAQPRHVRRQFRRHDHVLDSTQQNNLHLIIDGWACRSRTTADGRRQILGMLLPGDVYGTATVTTASVDFAVVALSAVVTEIRPLANESPVLILEHALADAAISARWIARLGQRSAAGKIADMIDELVSRQNLPSTDHVPAADFRMTQYDLADATGLTAIHVNRTLREMRANDIFRIRRGIIEIPSMQLLRRVAEGVS